MVPRWARAGSGVIAFASCFMLLIHYLLFMERTTWIIASIACTVAVAGTSLLLGVLRRVPNPATLGACIGGIIGVHVAAWFMVVGDADGETFHSGILKASTLAAVSSSVTAIEVCRRSGSILSTLVATVFISAGTTAAQVGCICLVHPDVAWAVPVVLVGVYLVLALKAE